MPNYETHLGIGAMLALLGGSYAFAWFNQVPRLPQNYAVFIGIWTFNAICVGSILPDIDLHNSKPRRLLNGGLILGSAGIAYTLVLFKTAGGFNAPNGYHVAGFLAAVVVLTVAARIIPTLVQEIMPSHRGFLHNPVVYLAVFCVPAYGFWTRDFNIPGVDPVYEVLFGVPLLAGLFVGAWLHLGLDASSFLNDELNRIQRKRRF